VRRCVWSRNLEDEEVKVRYWAVENTTTVGCNARKTNSKQTNIFTAIQRNRTNLKENSHSFRVSLDCAYVTPKDSSFKITFTRICLPLFSNMYYKLSLRHPDFLLGILEILRICPTFYILVVFTIRTRYNYVDIKNKWHYIFSFSNQSLLFTNWCTIELFKRILKFTLKQLLHVSV
jgi:hypothetical protein